MTELRKLKEMMGMGLETLDKRVGEAECAVSAKVEAEVKVVRDAVKSLEDHAGRTAEARLRERASPKNVASLQWQGRPTFLPHRGGRHRACRCCSKGGRQAAAP